MDYELLLTAPSGGETRDFAQLVQTMSWSGSVRQTARELSATLAVPRDGSVTPPALREGAYLTLRRAGETVFTGPLLTATTSSQDSLVDLSALDRGRFLVGNEGWYSFSGITPETAAAAIARDYGIPVAALAAAGVSVSRKFPGVALDKIIRTLYGLAGEQNGKRYLVRFTGGGALEVVEKPTSASLSIASTMAVTNTWDITNLQNSVAIRTQEGALVRRVEDADSVALNGRLEHVITQRDGEDAGQRGPGLAGGQRPPAEPDGGDPGRPPAHHRRGGAAEGHGQRGVRPVLDRRRHPHLEERAVLLQADAELPQPGGRHQGGQRTVRGGRAWTAWNRAAGASPPPL